MNAFSEKLKRITAALGLAALCFVLIEGWSLAAPYRGRFAARRDVRHGHYKLLLYGLPPLRRQQYVQLLQKRYGIEVDTVAYCIVSEPMRSYVDSYDYVSFAAANHKFGHDIFEECWKDAQDALGASAAK
jgi:hypothetical protein